MITLYFKKDNLIRKSHLSLAFELSKNNAIIEHIFREEYLRERVQRFWENLSLKRENGLTNIIK